ncbi:Hypothetical protein D9617_1g080250 [Elsinoe fawcettii]|nr:Hypothetical protein D9617_1g080250 [Elsinoe fawcettii]
MFSENETATLAKDLASFRYVSTTATNNLQGILSSHEKLIADYKSLLSDYEETKEARDRYKRQARGGEGTPFVVVLIDGDNYPFDDAFVGKAADGGTNAAEFLHAFFKDHIRKLGLAPETKLVVRYVVNLAEASRMFHLLQLTGSHSRSLATFTAAFTAAKPLCDVIDSGDKPSTTDVKIKENFDLYINTSACKHIFFAGCNNQKNLDLLRPYERRSERITLIRNAQSWPQFSSLGLRTEELTNVFQDGRAPTPDRWSGNLSAKPAAKYVPPIQRRQTEEDNKHEVKRRPITAMSHRPVQPPPQATPKVKPSKPNQDLITYCSEPETSPERRPVSPGPIRDDQNTPRPTHRHVAPPYEEVHRATDQYHDPYSFKTVNDSEPGRQDDIEDRYSRRDTYNAHVDNYNSNPDGYSGPNAETSDEYSYEAYNETRHASYSSETSRTQWSRQKAKEQAQLQPVCTHWIKGICKYGDNCHKRHEVPPDPRGPGILDNYGPGRAVASNDWRLPDRSRKSMSESSGPPPQHKSLGQRGSTFQGRAYPEEPDQVFNSASDFHEIISNLPQRSDGNRDLIPVNRSEWRLDYHPGDPPSKNDMAAWEEKKRTFEPCYDFHLKGKCKEGAHCAKEHLPLDPKLVEVMRWIAHDAPCKKQGACRDRTCSLAHICYNPNCRNGNKFIGCRLPTALHHVDPHVADYVPAIVPHEELSEEDRQLAGQPIEVIEGDLLGVEEEDRPVNKLNMTSRWAQDMPHPHQSGDNTPTRPVHSEAPLKPADDSGNELRPTSTPKPNGRTAWDPFMPSPTQQKKSPYTNSVHDQVKTNGRDSPRRQKYSFEPPTDTEPIADEEPSGQSWNEGVSGHSHHSDVAQTDDIHQSSTSNTHTSSPSQEEEEYTYLAAMYRTPKIPGWTTLETLVNKYAEPSPETQSPQPARDESRASSRPEESRHPTPASVMPIPKGSPRPESTEHSPERTTATADSSTSEPLTLKATEDKNTKLASDAVPGPITGSSFASTGPASESVDELFDTESRTPTSRSPLPVAAQPVSNGAVHSAEDDQAPEARKASHVSQPESKLSSRLKVTASSFTPGDAFVPGASTHSAGSPDPSSSAALPSPATKPSPKPSSTPFSPLGGSKHACRKSSAVAIKNPNDVIKKPPSPVTSPPAPTSAPPPASAPEPDPSPAPATPKKKSSHSRTASSLTAVRGDHNKTDSLASRQAPRLSKSGDARNDTSGPTPLQNSHSGSFGDGAPGSFDSYNAYTHSAQQSTAWDPSWGPQDYQPAQWDKGQSTGNTWDSWGGEERGQGWDAPSMSANWNGNGRGGYGRSQRNDTSGYGKGRGWGGGEEQGQNDGGGEYGDSYNAGYGNDYGNGGYGNGGAYGDGGGYGGYGTGGYGSSADYNMMAEYGYAEADVAKAQQEAASMTRTIEDVVRENEEMDRRRVAGEV